MLAGFLALVAVAVAINQAASGNDWDRYDRRAFGVSPGELPDTVVILDDGVRRIVRLLGVATPEPGQHGFDQSIDYLKARLSRVPEVTLKLETTQTRDAGGNLLAYVYLADNDCLNLAMVRDGKAYADRRAKHPYAPQYEQAEGDARKKSRGIWKDLSDDLMPAWRRDWLMHLRNERTSSTQPTRR